MQKKLSGSAPYGRKATHAGFTIVELLIVIVVIAILAAISVVAYQGMQNRAKNSKTLASVGAWAKAIKLYQVDNGSWPTPATCLGSDSTYDGDGRCWSNISMTVSSTLVDAVKPYMGNGAPEPDTTIATSSGHTFRGARYQTDGVIYYVLVGQNTCPQVSGIEQSYVAVLSGGVMCGGNIQ